MMIQKLYLSYKWTIGLSLILLWTSAFSQSKGYYIHLENTNLDRTVLTSNFATEVNSDEVIYSRIEHRFKGLSSESETVSLMTKLIRSNIDGTILNSTLVESDSLELFELNVYRFKDMIIVNGMGRSLTNYYIVSMVYDLDLNYLKSQNFYYAKRTNTDYSSIYRVMVKVLPKNMYLVHNDNSMVMRYDTLGNVEKTAILRNPTYSNNPTVNLDEFAVNPETGELLGFDGLATYRFDKDFKFISYNNTGLRSIYNSNLPSWLNIFSGYEYIGNDQYLGWGHIFGLDSINDLTLNTLGLGVFNSDLEPVKNISIIDFDLEESSDIACRSTGGLFKGTDGYYTFSEGIPKNEYENYLLSSYFFVNKYDFELNTIWQRKFIFRKDYRYLQLYAELTPTNAFLISGENWDISRATHWPFHVGGHIINLGSDGSFSTLGVNKTESGIAFSVIENPVRDKFTVIKDINDAKSYTVKVFDMQGRVMASEKNWDTDRLSIDVSSLIAGTYCYTISDGTIVLYSGKFVKIR